MEKIKGKRLLPYIENNKKKGNGAKEKASTKKL